jgi:hypothetical protein
MLVLYSFHSLDVLFTKEKLTNEPTSHRQHKSILFEIHTLLSRIIMYSPGIWILYLQCLYGKCMYVCIRAYGDSLIKVILAGKVTRVSHKPCKYNIQIPGLYYCIHMIHRYIHTTDRYNINHNKMIHYSRDWRSKSTTHHCWRRIFSEKNNRTF